MKLLFIVLNSTDMIEEVLEGSSGRRDGRHRSWTPSAWVTSSRTCRFRRMRNLFRAARPRNNMIFSVVDDSQAREVHSKYSTRSSTAPMAKGHGIAFTLPIDAAIGVTGALTRRVRRRHHRCGRNRRVPSPGGSRYRLAVALIERCVDVSFGVSKANSGIIHAGFHHPPRR